VRHEDTPRIERGISAAPVRTRNEFELDASFRLVSCYDVNTDGSITRFDVSLNAKEDERRRIVSSVRLNTILQSTRPQEIGGNRHYGEMEIPHGPGILGAFGIMMNRDDLVIALRGLADEIEATPAVIRE